MALDYDYGDSDRYCSHCRCADPCDCVDCEVCGRHRECDSCDGWGSQPSTCECERHDCPECGTVDVVRGYCPEGCDAPEGAGGDHG